MDMERVWAPNRKGFYRRRCLQRFTYDHQRRFRRGADTHARHDGGSVSTRTSSRWIRTTTFWSSTIGLHRQSARYPLKRARSSIRKAIRSATPYRDFGRWTTAALTSIARARIAKQANATPIFRAMADSLTGSTGEYYFRTNQAVFAIPGRTPHLHGRCPNQGESRVHHSVFCSRRSAERPDGVAVRGVRRRKDSVHR